MRTSEEQTKAAQKLAHDVEIQKSQLLADKADMKDTINQKAKEFYDMFKGIKSVDLAYQRWSAER